MTASGERYPYRDVPLTPALFATLASELFAGQMAKRADIARAVEEHHQSLGGGRANQQGFQLVKKALDYLERDGVAESVPGGHGLWKFRSSSQEDERFKEQSDSWSDVVLHDELEQADFHCVYVYDLPAYAELAELRGDVNWPHKIGFTSVSAESRISGQVGTALPETPRLVLTHSCSDARLLERAIHSILEIRGQKVAGVPGTEWFNTNPSEVQGLIDFIFGIPLGKE